MKTDGLDIRRTPDPVRSAGDRNARSEGDGALRRAGACVSPWHRCVRGSLSAVLLLGLLAGCDQAGDPVEPAADAIDIETKLDDLFAPPTTAEVEAVRADWAQRDISAAEVTIELTESYPLSETPATLRIVSHRVGEVLHYGAILAPDSAAPGSLPILMYLHGGDSGVEVDEIALVIFALGELRDNFVYVIPSFRSEPLEYENQEWISTGPGGHWDYDVDDALALLNVALELTPQARIEDLSIVGGSRGAGVALLAGIRDERIENIVALFGPTDFFDDWVREIARDAAMGSPRDLPGVAHIDTTFIQPYMRDEIDLAEVRLELVRRSSVLFAEDLPAVQLHHGDADGTVAVSQAHSLIRAMEALGREPPEFEAFIYEGGGHTLFSLRGAIPRAVDFLRRTLGGESALVATTASR